MRYAMVSDIHANMQAWNAVLLDIRSNEVDRIVCLGDIVGYGPEPRPVLESVYANVDCFALGNHDAVLCGKMDADTFNQGARRMIEWTGDRLGNRAIKFLSSLPLCLQGENFKCTHGEFSDPACFNYVCEPEDATASWTAVDDALLFNGHTHCPGIFIVGQSGTPHRIDPEDFVLEEGKRFLVNVGSVGQPRDGDARASYCIYDSDEGAVLWRRIPFDLDAFRTSIEREGVPASASPFLADDPRAGRAPLRDMVDFSPPTDRTKATRNAVELQSLNVLQKRERRWRTTAIILVMLLVATGLCAYLGWKRFSNRSMRLAGTEMIPVPALLAADNDGARSPENGNLLADIVAPVSASGRLEGWDLVLGNRYAQSIAVRDTGEGTQAFVMESQAGGKTEMSVTSRPIEVQPDMVMMLDAFFLKDDDFEGSVSVAVGLTKEDGETIRNFVVKEPLIDRRGGWEEAKKTFELPARSRSLVLSVRGRFRGKVTVKNISLVRKK